jgi:hypothetical protein
LLSLPNIAKSTVARVPTSYKENTRACYWVGTQKAIQVVEGKKSYHSARIQALESMGFEWIGHNYRLGDRLSELADYRNINGHCVPKIQPTPRPGYLGH